MRLPLLHLRLLLWLFVALCGIPVAARSDAGRIEINQASVADAGGFPFLISEPGSYVLTSDLVVSTDVSAIQLHGPLLAGQQVSLDLSGFSIVGASSCKVGACSSGSAAGIEGFAGAPGRATVRNGTVRGFSGNCVFVSTDSLVEELLVSSCGRDGIVADLRSIVLRNRVDSTGQRGIKMGAGTAFAHNTASDANLSSSFPGVDFRAVEGGTPTAGNSCDDGSCSPEGKRDFYLTSTFHTGASAGSACAAGFHVAQLSEIWEPSGLHYNGLFGFQDPGEAGAPMGSLGWIYGTDDNEDCSNYTSNAGDGQFATLEALPSDASWTVLETPCVRQIRVWCVRD